MLNVNRRPHFSRTVFEGTSEQFRVRFLAKTVDELAAFDITKPAGESALLHAVVVDLEDVADGDGAEPAQFSPLLLDRVIAMLHVRAALLQAYYSGLRELTPGN